ncbi:MAG: hypothetical protein Q8O13_06955 [Candidatus Omnitrophota bacterium]|nr:hypothetical protein [Candidatus Omnitrophota bacterium]
MYEEIKIKCQAQLNQRIVTIPGCVSTCVPLAGHWISKRRTMERIVAALMKPEKNSFKPAGVPRL